MIFFSLLIPDMTNEEEQMLDEALIKTYIMPVSDESDRHAEPEKERKPARRKSLYSSAQPPTEF